MYPKKRILSYTEHEAQILSSFILKKNVTPHVIPSAARDLLQGRQPRRTGHNLLRRLLHYNVEYLVYYEACENIVVAIKREKQIKAWSRKKKNALINTLNPEWNDLYPSLC